MFFKNLKQKKEELTQKRDALKESIASKQKAKAKPKKDMIRTYGGDLLPKDPSKLGRYWNVFVWAVHNPLYSQMVEAETDTFRNLVKESLSKSVTVQRGAYKSYVEFLDYALPHYYEFGQYVGDYFKQSVYESEEARQYRERYQYIEDNLEKLLDEENKQAHFLREIEGLKAIILDEIAADEGTVQSEYIKTFPEEKQHLVTRAIKILAADGYIEREKSGRSYILHIKEGQR